MNQVLATTELNTVFEECLVLKQELIDGLCAENKYINPKFFYDEAGSQLFEKIMQLPEYYPSRTEMSLLEKFKHEIAEALGENIVLIEPGAGNCEKVQYILQTLKPICYMPIDISADFLFDCARKLQNKYSFINIHAVADDMKAKVEIPDAFKNNDKVVFYPGSTIGNYNQKEKEILDAAYNDKHGITARFNLNALKHANKLLDCNIDINLFEHVAFYNEDRCRIEMHLESKAEHAYNIDNVIQVCFSEFERIHTEYSYKYTIESFANMAEKAGLKLEKYWIDDDELFSVQYYKVT